MQNKLEFYWDPSSQPCRAIAALLITGNIDFESHFVDLTKDE